MPKIVYVERNFSSANLAIIEEADAICEDYARQGYSLTLRQVYYLFIARDLFPDSWIDPEYNLRHGLEPDTKNTQKNYKRLGSILNDARLAGMLDWDHIEDRTRNLRDLPNWRDPADVMAWMAQRYRIDKWERQQYRPEVWIEKDALVGVIEPVCIRNQVPFFSCRGYTSQSEVWGAAQRLLGHALAGYRPIVFHLGDHDPSGVDMSRDIESRLEMFFFQDWATALMHDWARDNRDEIGGHGKGWAENAFRLHFNARVSDRPYVELRRIALTMDQIDQYDPPPNPAKATDARWRGYVETTGMEDSWELDALEPTALDALIQDSLDSIRDATIWDEDVEREESERERLFRVSDRWEDVEEFVAAP